MARTYSVFQTLGIAEAVEMVSTSALALEDMRVAQPIVNQMLSAAYIKRWARWGGYLYDTGRLERSFTETSRTGDALRRAHVDSIEYGSSVPYARFYSGQLLEVDNAMINDMATALADFYAGHRVVRGHMRGGSWVKPYIRANVALAMSHG